jgi:hypothetical protein
MLNFLIGDRGLRNIRNRGQEFAREMYDPNVFNPQRQAATQQATQGINTNLPRTAALSQLGRIQNDGDIFGGNAGRMVGAMGEQNAAMTRSLAGMETQLGLADQQARMQGRQALANVQSQQLQTAATRDAAVTEADMMYEAEKSSRRFALVGAGIGLGAAAIGSGAFKGGALSLFNKLTGADGIPEGASMDIPTVQGGNLASTLRNRNGGPGGITPGSIVAGMYVPGRLPLNGTVNIDPTTAGQSLEGGDFSSTFANARRLGAQTFNWNGNSYNTRLADEPRATAATPTATTAPVEAPAITPIEDLTQPTATGPSEQARASLMTAARSGVGIDRLTEAFAPMGFSVDEIQSFVFGNEPNRPFVAPRNQPDSFAPDAFIDTQMNYLPPKPLSQVDRVMPLRNRWDYQERTGTQAVSANLSAEQRTRLNRENQTQSAIARIDEMYPGNAENRPFTEQLRSLTPDGINYMMQFESGELQPIVERLMQNPILLRQLNPEVRRSLTVAYPELAQAFRNL